MCAARAETLVPTPEPTRRDVLTIAGGAFAAVGGLVSLWPLLQQMTPDAATLALANIEVDLRPVAVGQSITVLWRGKAVFIRHRTSAEIEAARAVPVDGLPDRKSRMAGRPESAPAVDANRTKPGRENWLIVVGICTHLGCVPQGQRLGERRGDYGGWFCSCHGSQYDTAGRVRAGPAPANLEVPPYHFVTDTLVEIGRLQRPPPAA